jgi:hypothetical protein
VPALLKDAKAAPFFRANLALAYAKALSNRRVHEEALDTLKAVTPEQVIDPASYLFHRAVCEHALVLKKEATGTINRLLEDALDAPERYKTVATLMLLDMQTWKDKKDLGAIPQDEELRAPARAGPRRPPDPEDPEGDRRPPRRDHQGAGEQEEKGRGRWLTQRRILTQRWSAARQFAGWWSSDAADAR